jgi:hypothetical protein
MAKGKAKRPGDEPDKPQHTGEMRNGRLSPIKNKNTGDNPTPNEFTSREEH